MPSSFVSPEDQSSIEVILELYWGYIGIAENTRETTIQGLGFRGSGFKEGLGFRAQFSNCSGRAIHGPM